MKIQNRIAIIVVLLGLLAILFQEQLWDAISQWRMKNDPRAVVASIENVSNDVKFRYPTSLIWRRVHSGLELRDNDTVATDPDSSAVVTFKSGLKVELEPNSLIVVHNYGGGADSLELTFLKGGMKVLNAPPTMILPPLKVKKVEISALPVPTPSPEAPQKVALDEKALAPTATPRPKKEIRETLPESYIVLVIKNQQNLLNRCYYQHLRLNPQAKGRIDANLTINPDGNVNRVLIIRSSIPDPSLQQCVVTVLSRARFRPYNGDPIIFTYPINLD